MRVGICVARVGEHYRDIGALSQRNLKYRGGHQISAQNKFQPNRLLLVALPRSQQDDQLIIRRGGCVNLTLILSAATPLVCRQPEHFSRISIEEVPM
jgi:hypothetical protein